MLITSSLKTYVTKHPLKLAIQCGSTAKSYAQLWATVESISRYLLHQYSQNTRINPSAHSGAHSSNPPKYVATSSDYGNPNYYRKMVLLMPNCIEFIEYFLAAAMSGWIAIPLDPKWVSKQIETTVATIQPDLLIVDDGLMAQCEALSIPSTCTIIEAKSFLHIVSQSELVDAKKQRLEKGQLHSSDGVSGDALFYMGFTSGTTGVPKGFMRSHQSWVKSFEVSEQCFHLNAEDRLLIPGPLCHSISLYGAVQALYMGASVHVLSTFSAQEVIDHMDKHKISATYMVPTMIEACLPLWEDTSPLNQFKMISSGAKWQPASKERLANALPHASLYEFYGASELSFVTALSPEQNEQKPDSVGKAVPGCRLSIRDTEGQEVAIGEVGQLFVQSDMVFAGYFNDEKATTDVLQHGWATVGDLAYLDEDGFVYLVGRAKNMLISGGLNIFPEEIERVLINHPSVKDVAIIGIEDDYWGDKVVAIIEAMDDTIEQSLIQLCKMHLPKYKCPKAFIFMNQLPYTSSGKIARQKLRQQLNPQTDSFIETLN